MPNVLFAVSVVIIWVALGLTAALFLGRHGHRNPLWYLVAIALGPLFLPIALELSMKPGAVLSRTETRGDKGPCRTVLVSLDGSSESDAALTDATQVLDPAGVRFTLLTILDPDLGDDDLEAKRTAELFLESRARRLPEGCQPPVHEVAIGDPAKLILERALAEQADLLVLGRRGRGLSERFLGSVADRVVRDSSCPVLVGGVPSTGP